MLRALHFPNDLGNRTPSIILNELPHMLHIAKKEVIINICDECAYQKVRNESKLACFWGFLGSILVL